MKDSWNDQVTTEVQNTVLDSYIQSLGKKRRPVIGDGHCLMRAFYLCIENSGLLKTVHSYRQKMKLSRSHILQNFSHYKPFFNGSEAELEMQLNEYVNENKCTRDAFDLLLLLLCKQYECTAVVYYVYGDEVKHHSLIPSFPNIKSKAAIELLFVKGHYDSIIDENFSIAQSKPDVVDVFESPVKGSTAVEISDSSRFKEITEISDSPVKVSLESHVKGAHDKVQSEPKEPKQKFRFEDRIDSSNSRVKNELKEPKRELTYEIHKFSEDGSE